MYDVVVVGAGVMGSATAYWLSRAGKRVALLEQFSPAHVRASSADESRTIRYQYRGQAAYTRMVAGAVELWKEFDRQSGTDFYRETGTLTLQTQPGLEPLLDGYQGLCDLGYEPALAGRQRRSARVSAVRERGLRLHHGGRWRLHRRRTRDSCAGRGSRRARRGRTHGRRSRRAAPVRRTCHLRGDTRRTRLRRRSQSSSRPVPGRLACSRISPSACNQPPLACTT